MFVYQRVTKQKMRRTQKHIRCLQKPGWPCWPWRGWVWKSRGSHHIWLVVDLPIWKIWVRQLAWLFPIIMWKNKKCSKPPTRYNLNRRINDHHCPKRLGLLSLLCSWNQEPHGSWSSACSEAIQTQIHLASFGGLLRKVRSYLQLTCRH